MGEKLCDDSSINHILLCDCMLQSDSSLLYSLKTNTNDKREFKSAPSQAARSTPDIVNCCDKRKMNGARRRKAIN